MTLFLRRKRQTTVPARNTPARMAASLLGLGLLLAAQSAGAQEVGDTGGKAPWRPARQTKASPMSDAPAAPAKATITYHKEPDAPPPMTLQQAAFQQGSYSQSTGGNTGVTGPYSTTTDETSTIITLVPPGFERVFGRLESEASFNERVRQANRSKVPIDRTNFPPEPIVSKEPYKPRTFVAHNLIVEPNFVPHGHLLFEQKNLERGGWDLGILSPVASAGKFYCDFVTLPYQLASQIGRGIETSAGKCLPGDPTPFLLYPPEMHVTAGFVQTAAVIGLIAIFP
jgi:hypothetical protein